jgi:hypothetical protein
LALYQCPNPASLRLRRAALRTAVNGLYRPLPEFRDAQARVAAGTTAPVNATAPAAPDPTRTREEVEAAL